jgi:signal transduction histidine kinase
MVSETDRLTRLINNVLDFSKMEKGKRDYKIKRLDAAFLVEDMVESQRIRLEHNGFSVNCNNDMGQMWIDGDEEALKQAVLNLLSNAEKYSPADRSIDVEVTGTEDRVLINIKDRGIGISPAEAKKIFREFYRADESLTSKVRGSGLGLTISQRIIQDHGGDIRYIPREGGGSIFQLSLPRKGRS